MLKEVQEECDYEVSSKLPNDIIIVSTGSEISNLDNKALIEELEIDLCTYYAEKHMHYLENQITEYEK